MQPNEKAMTKGSKVEFVSPQSGENGYPMFIVWADRERCMIVTDIGWGNLNPTQVVSVSDLKLV